MLSIYYQNTEQCRHFSMMMTINLLSSHSVFTLFLPTPEDSNNHLFSHLLDLNTCF